MPKLTEAHFAARREQILAAAFQCLARAGYSRLTVRDIAAEAGISVGTLYLHFDNKQDIVRALVEQGREFDEAGIEEAPVPADPLGRLGAVIGYLIDRLDHPDSLAELRVDVELWAEAIHQPAVHELFQDSSRYWQRRLSDVVEDVQAEGVLPSSIKPASLAQLLIAMLTGLTLTKVMQPETSLAPVADSLRSLLAGRIDSHRSSPAD